jgi:hypothetical protein
MARSPAKADYLRNCEEGLEECSDRRMAKLMRWSRIREADREIDGRFGRTTTRRGL